MGIHRLLAGEDGPGRRALPLGELLHPVPLAAVVVLLVNDHVLKGAGVVPAAITGKLSDLAGLLFFPLLLTSAVDLLLLCAARAGVRVDFTLSRGKLAAAIAMTAVAFTTIKLSRPVAEAAAATLGAIGFHSRIVADPTDLWALPALAVAAWIGLAEIARVPLGRVELVERCLRAGDDPARRLADLARRWPRPADPARVAAVSALAEGLTRYVATGEAADAAAALRWFRAPRAPRRRRP